MSVDPARQAGEKTSGRPAASARWPRLAEFAWQDVPEKMEAGGDWAQAHLIVDNSNGALKEDDPYKLSLRIFPAASKPEDYRVQAFFDGAWRDAEPPTSDGTFSTTTLVQGVGFPASRVVVPIRVQVGPNVPPADTANLIARINGPHWQASEPSRTKITAPDPGKEEPGKEDPGAAEPGNGEPSSDPTSDPHPRPEPEKGGSVVPTEGRPEQNGAAGALAETGTGKGTAWALGTGGTAALIGGAVVTGARRHRLRHRS
ncbi:hypothetical protein [Streptomyces sp. NPDC093111]|uniref:hypothetical protein n=1 Tax=Streptomyces sp. NPDC093111 TaxID=3154978 RepID=UPI0034292C69